MRPTPTALAAIASLAFAGSAQAVTVLAEPGDMPPPSDQELAVDFEGSIASRFALTLAGAAAVYDGALGLVEGIAAPPPGTASRYLAIGEGGSATLTTPSIRRLSVYIGSPDSYNAIHFIGEGGYEARLEGAALAGGMFNGDQSIGRRMTYDFGQHRVTQVVFSSSGDAFELDNIAVGIVPEPGAWALMIAGVGMIGAALRARSRKVFRLA